MLLCDLQTLQEWGREKDAPAKPPTALPNQHVGDLRQKTFTRMMLGLTQEQAKALPIERLVELFESNCQTKVGTPEQRLKLRAMWMSFLSQTKA